MLLYVMALPTAFVNLIQNYVVRMFCAFRVDSHYLSLGTNNSFKYLYAMM